MKTLSLILLVPIVAACATLGRGSRAPGEAGRDLLWRQAFDAYSHDSLRVAEAMYQRLAAEYPRTHEGHEARYFLALLNLDPRAGADVRAAEQHLSIYLADDSAQSLRGGYRREAGTLLGVVRQLRTSCGERAPGFTAGCDTTVVSRTVTQPTENGGGPSAAEMARLRRGYTERGDTIRDLRAELERIRNTLAPRRP